MKNIELNNQASKLLFKGQKDFYEKQLESSTRGLTPGEWVTINEQSIGYVNMFASETTPCLRVLKKESISEVKTYIKQAIIDSIERRKSIGIEYGRVVYGSNDFLSGLVVDRFKDTVLVNITTMGMYQFSSYIKEVLEDQYGCNCFVFTKSRDCEKESMPQNLSLSFDKDICAIENDMEIVVHHKNLQKVGYYYDHAYNRETLQRWMKKLSVSGRGLDLFSYVGSWGLMMLASGLGHVDFVDQGDFDANINENIFLNNLKNDGNFQRADVFDFLGSVETNYNVIVSDPPAFAKDKRSTKAAIRAYTKLHQKVLKISEKGTLIVFGSCTHYVSLEDFQKTIYEASRSEKKELQLLDIGFQRQDHPITKLGEKSNYIKCLFYIVR